MPTAAPTDPATAGEGSGPPPSWVVGLCGVAAVGSVFFFLLLFLNR